ncbi:MAG: Asp-tRNA(Asn)/Glu-tRNA(Gln) amidotransferase subunit GatB [Herpetosiphonaceae bacterium]|nr:Asp-tRNA(Asn)/Glu-tRNA(Gln) amidotransferase subunit GatB [Herpetosiphonaceae bacterium]
MEYEAVIGLEVHAQVLTNSKMFCGCSADYANATPNTHLCPVCLGLPGSLPVVNQRATELIALTGLALNCRINPTNIISRKQYFYVDLPSNYQRTQYEEPICSAGWVMIEVGGEQRRIGITRAHMEEDTGKLQHAADGSLIDYNRAGVPLMEIVSEPDIRTPEEARLYLQKMRQILVWIAVNSGNLEDGAFRCDANVSVRPRGSTTFGTKVEVKNMNSFRNVERALHAEIERQSKLLAAGGTVVQETRGWDEARGTTVGQRSKEQAHDYRYFPEPDIPPIQLSPEWIETRQAALPVLPDERRQRFVTDYGLSAQDASLLTDERVVADYYEQAVAAAPEQTPKAIANWMTGELFRLLNDTGEPLDAASERVPPTMIAELLNLLKDGTLTGPVAKQVFEETFRTGQPPAVIVATKGLRQISDTSAISELARSAVAVNPKAVAEYKAGKSQAIKFLVGQVMKASKGQANPKLAEQALAEVLAE